MKALACLIWLFAPSVFWRQKDFTFMRRKSVLDANKPHQLETERVTVRDLEFNFEAALHAGGC